VLMWLESDEEYNTNVIEYFFSFQRLFAHLNTINSLGVMQF
jgi:hypothetical protein